MKRTIFVSLLFCLFLIPQLGHSTPKKLKCELKFQLKSWSVFYKTGKGHGTISCNDGQRSEVKLKIHGGGITFGKENIINGKGHFSPVHRIQELYGKYSASEAHAGAAKTATALSLSKDGDISLSLSGTGTGGGIGFDFGRFTITPVKP